MGVIARDHLGEVIRAWGRCRPLCFPLQAEAAALQWAVELASREQWHQVIFEGDANSCFDVLSSSAPSPDWSISTYISNILSLSSAFPSVRFCWVRRLCNSAAHAVAKFSLSSHQSFFFNNDILPPDIKSVCKVDYLSCTSFFCLMTLHITKKKE